MIYSSVIVTVKNNERALGVERSSNISVVHRQL